MAAAQNLANVAACLMLQLGRWTFQPMQGSRYQRTHAGVGRWTRRLEVGWRASNGCTWSLIYPVLRVDVSYMRAPEAADQSVRRREGLFT
jgi:hypothetical protein